MDEGTDRGTDPGEDGVWLTYRELADSRQIDRHSAVKLVLKHGWRRQRDNRNVLRILVPVEWLAPRGRGMPKTTDQAIPPMPEGMAQGVPEGTDFTHAINAFDAALTVLREQLATANARAEASEQRADRLDLLIEAERGRVIMVEAKAAIEVAGLNAQVAALQAQLRDAQAAAQRAEAVERENDARRARGLLARLRAAWRGQ